MKKTKSYYERFMAMTDAERDAEVARFDSEDLSPPRPLSKTDRQRHRKARLRGRPKVGKGAKRVMVSVERGLLKEADGYAKAQGMSRSELIGRALRGVLGKAS
jgi:hypothetical protein